LRRRVGAALQSFFELNRKASARIGRRLPHATPNIQRVYEETVARYLNAQPRQLVVDVGAGRTSHFARFRTDTSTRIVAVDASEEEVRHNADADEIRIANVVENLPFAANEVDLLVTRSVLEHLPDVRRFIENSARVIRPGGYCIHLFPSKFAPFALINQALPSRVSATLVHFVRPGTENVLGFPTFYDRTYRSAVKSMLEETGFSVVEETTTYAQSSYFAFLVPLFLLSAAYELLVSHVGVRDLGAYTLIVARKDTPLDGRA
jgi:ubiquinone/menaquinone biosynthesis C-methylase UbiE